MDPKRYMIIANGKWVTEDVEECRFSETERKWNIVFRGTGKTYGYSPQNLIFMIKPEKMPHQQKRVYYNQRLLEGISEIYAFKSGVGEEYWHICFRNGMGRDFRRSDLVIHQMMEKKPGDGNAFSYLQEAAGKLGPVKEGEPSMLETQYEKMGELEDSAASFFLDPGKYPHNPQRLSNPPIFPFGCNESQLKAVTNALTNRISVIEGPPGTGKT
ncbi:MAG: hypothetical protein HUJ54_06490, partial [Erysipelotrichaceae bacterium]|nr:hypothetical protein [Erysipelotrichaceae bacterium]